MKNRLFKLLIAASLCLTCNLSLAQEADTPLPLTKDGLNQAFDEQNWEQATQIANELLKTEPENADYLNILGVSLAQIKKFEEAEVIFNKLLTLHPEDKRSYANLCVIQKTLNQKDKALETCLEATKRVTDDPSLLYTTAQMLEDKNRKDEALKLYEAAYQLNPESSVLLTGYTSILSENGEFAKVVELTEKAIRTGNTKAILYLNAILAANRAGMYEKAIELADEGFNKYKDPSISLGKAEALTGLKKYEEADAIWSELEPVVEQKSSTRGRLEAGYAKSLLARACTTEAYKTCGTETPDPCCARETAALPLIKAAQSRSKRLLRTERALVVNYSLALILNNKLEEAEALLTSAMENDMNQDSAGAAAALAVALYQFGDERDKEAALRYYAQAVEISPDFSDIERVRETRIWPPRLLDTLKNIQNDAAAQHQKSKKSGCGCDIQQKSEMPLAALLSLILMILGVFGLRRKSNAI